MKKLAKLAPAIIYAPVALVFAVLAMAFSIPLRFLLTEE